MLTLIAKAENEIKKKVYLTTILILSLSILQFSCKKFIEPANTYATQGNYGDNILLKGKTEYTQAQNSLAAAIPIGGKLRIVISSLVSVKPKEAWTYDSISNKNWLIFKYDISDNAQRFSPLFAIKKCDLKINFARGTYKIDYYETDSSEITSTKTIRVNY